MMRQKRFPQIILFLVLASSLYLGACAPQENADEEVEAAAERDIPVRTAQPQQMELALVETYSATVQAWETAQILGQTGLRIEEIYVEEGDRVRKGQRIARMDESNLRQAQVELRSSESDLNRLRRLVDIGAVASQQLEHAEARFETAQTTVTMLNENTHLVSPIAGIVTDKYFVPGEQFMPGAQGPAIVTVQQLDPLKVVIDISERFYADIEEGMPAKIAVDAYRDQEFAGQIFRKSRTIDPMSRTFTVEIQLDNKDGRLSPGMSGEVQLPMGDIKGTFLPRAALIYEPGQRDPFVYVIEDGTARRVFVQAGRRVERFQEILGGLDQSAQVVIEGMGRLNEGSSVEILNPNEQQQPSEPQEPAQEGRAHEMDEGEGEPS